MDPHPFGGEEQSLGQLLDALRHGRAIPVPDVRVAELPSTPGAYTLWASEASLVYTGLAGVRWTPERPSATSTLRRRLGDHLSAHRADVLTSYLFERVVTRRLTVGEIARMADGELSIRDLVLNELTVMSLAWVSTASYAVAKRIEDEVRAGALGQVPMINPL
jgi:hypothetical protein